MNVCGGQRGELLLPILVVLFLFGSFWVAYVRWCERIYWSMRMDMAADAVALSAAREEAAMLNTIGTFEYLENLLIQKVRIAGEDYAHVQMSVAQTFEEYRAGLLAAVRMYRPAVLNVARIVAKANGADRLPSPIPMPEHHLKLQRVTVIYFHGLIPVLRQDNRAVYFARDWWPRKEAPQPIHRTTWLVGHGDVWEKGKARLWLDVDPRNKANNGGFPSEQAAGLQALGIQCNFPQFNARLMPKYFGNFQYVELKGSGSN